MVDSNHRIYSWPTLDNLDKRLARVFRTPGLALCFPLSVSKSLQGNERIDPGKYQWCVGY